MQFKNVLIICVMSVFALVGCATSGTVDKAVESPYPMYAPDNPEQCAVLDSIIAKAQNERGWTLIGMAADTNGDTMLWFENEDGECVAFLVMFSQGQIFPIGSCEDALNMYQHCVDVGGCVPK